jgi:3-phenylpropionate/trans-cinnamate dioxygenase ferredoxin reductase component
MQIVIIGAGECGIRAALSLREQGFGGTITVVNGEAHAPYERPPLSKPHGIEIVARPIAGSDRFRDLNITVLSDVKATAINRHARKIDLDNQSHLPYDKLLLATGASPRALPYHPKIKGPVFSFRSLDDATSIFGQIHQGTKLSIIGGGFIGLELASAARQRGGAVTVIEATNRLLSRAVPAQIADLLEAKHQLEGVKIVFSADIQAINENGSITLATGEHIESDVIVTGIGSQPNCALAASAGLTIDNGIAVNAFFQTSDPMIYAAGDCCSFPHALYDNKRVRLENWRAAQQQGDHVARAMLGDEIPFTSIPWFWSDQFDLGIQIAGLTLDADRSISRKNEDGSLILFHLAKDGRLLSAGGIGKGNMVARDIRIAEMLIQKGVCPNETALANPAIKLKTLLASETAP